MAIDGYEADRRVVVVHALSSKGAGKSERWTDEWDDSPSNVEVGHKYDWAYVSGRPIQRRCL